MKFQVSFKTPDTVEYTINGILIDAKYPNNVDRTNAIAELRDQLYAIADKYISYGECITIEFDTETQTAIVVEK